jgi:hypothetical protein
MTAPAARRVEVLWCSNNRQGRSNGWSFPPKVDRLLRELTADKRVVHLFGGLSRFGVRLDIDRATRPNVIGDAWLPPFGRDAFDVTILDPPYIGINQQMKLALLRGAAWIARERVIWFHTQWIASDSSLRLERAWLVRVGDSCAVRCIQVFTTSPDKQRPRLHFTRGPAMRYNRWLSGQLPLALERTTEALNATDTEIPAATAKSAARARGAAREHRAVARDDRPGSEGHR